MMANAFHVNTARVHLVPIVSNIHGYGLYLISQETNFRQVLLDSNSTPRFPK